MSIDIIKSGIETQQKFINQLLLPAAKCKNPPKAMHRARFMQVLTPFPHSNKLICNYYHCFPFTYCGTK